MQVTIQFRFEFPFGETEFETELEPQPHTRHDEGFTDLKVNGFRKAQFSSVKRTEDYILFILVKRLGRRAHARFAMAKPSPATPLQLAFKLRFWL